MEEDVAKTKKQKIAIFRLKPGILHTFSKVNMGS
jgi:hypothetical protein